MQLFQNKTERPSNGDAPQWVKAIIYTLLYLAFLYWVESWWGLLLVPFILDAYVTHFIPWGWWKKLKTKWLKNVMAWVDALVFALVAVYFLNQFFFQNFVIPSSSLEKTLLTGDYLLVSKLAYGPRIPQTPLSFPLMQHTMPVLNCNSYLEHPHWPYRRVKGLGKVKLSDIVVFNYPSGDTVATKMQDQDYYRVVYQVGTQLLEAQYGVSVLDSLRAAPTIAAQQAMYRHLYEAGAAYMHQQPEFFGKIVYRPVDRRENYVKRCVGMPGDRFEIKNDVIYLNGKPQPQPKEVQFNYIVTFKALPTTDMMKELGISNEDLSNPLPQANTFLMPLTAQVKAAFEKDTLRVASLQRSQPVDDWLYPQNMVKKWTTANYGPFVIPQKGMTMHLSLENLPLYQRPIEIYEGNQLAVKDNKIYINGKPTQTYTFKYDYYWMMGDNRDNSADSRFWGFVPETHVVGKPLFVWLSLDKDYGWTDGKIRWNRFFKNVSHIQ